MGEIASRDSTELLKWPIGKILGQCFAILHLSLTYHGCVSAILMRSPKSKRNQEELFGLKNKCRTSKIVKISAG